MLSIERWLAALESKASDDTLKIILVEDCETQTYVLSRAGCRPGALGVLYGTPLDVML